MTVRNVLKVTLACIYIYVIGNRSECLLTADGRDYRGLAYTTKTGRMCQQWNSQKVAYLSSLTNTFVQSVLSNMILKCCNGCAKCI